MKAGRAGGLLLFAALCACPKDEAPRPGGLRVALPPGWVAEEERSGSLRVGPRGRAVLLLEHQGEAALPEPKDLEDTVSAEGAELLSVKRETDLVLVRYRVSTEALDASAFVGARRLDGRLFLCASAPEVSESELRVAEGVCRDLKWGGVAP